MDKEEIIETEEKIEKALKKEHVNRQQAKEQSLKEDFADSEAKYILKDNSVDLEGKDVVKKVSSRILVQKTISPNFSFSQPEDDIDPKIKKSVENQSEKILSQMPPIQPPTPAGSSKNTTNTSVTPKDKTI